jgi:hypothetical protein
MKKKYLICGVIFAVIILVIVASTFTNSEIDKDSLSEIERYALFNSELTCKLSESGTSTMWQSMGEVEILAYEYAVEEVESLKIKYEESNQFWLLWRGYMKDMCPEVFERLGLPNN